MLDPFGNDQHNYFIPFADFFAGVCSIFLVVAVLLFFHITDPHQQKDKDGDIKSPGTVQVETFWKEDVDVDLWVKSPQDRPVGYSRKQGKFFDLLRDDLGMKYERVEDHHYENVYSRNAPPGEYVVNLHMYANRDNSAFPIGVDVYVSIVKKTGAKTDTKKVIHAKINLVQDGQEVTVVRFRLDEAGNLVPESVNYEPEKLREATAG